MKSGVTRTVCYRVNQFLRALTARVSEEEVEEALSTLTPASRALFRRQSVADQHHALAVYYTLCRAGRTNPHLLAAALLHDVGKGAARLPLWQRALVVLMNRFAPRLLDRLGQGNSRDHPHSDATGRPVEKSRWGPSFDYLPGGWRRPFAVQVQHAEIGARWAHEAGCSALTVNLIRRHHSELEPLCPGSLVSVEDLLLAALQAADSSN